MAKHARAELGMDLERRANDDAPTARPAYAVVSNDKDYFVERDGVRFAGCHLLLDLWGAQRLSDPEFIEKALRAGAKASGATVLHSNLHHFSPNGGVSGVLVLAESHISIHTWPERSFAAIDIFVCGDCDPHKAVPVLKKAFKPERIEVDDHKRGVVR